MMKHGMHVQAGHSLSLTGLSTPAFDIRKPSLKSKKSHKKTINDVAQPHTSKEEPCSHNSCSVCPLGGAFLLSWNVDIGSIPQLHWSSSIGHMWAEQSGPHHRTSASGISYPAAEANPASCLASIGKHGNTEKYPKDLLQKLSYMYVCM